MTAVRIKIQARGNHIGKRPDKSDIQNPPDAEFFQPGNKSKFICSFQHEIFFK